MPDDDAPWTDPAWLASARAWAAERIADCGCTISGPIEQPHVRWWSTVLRIPTSGGLLWMKASQPMYAFEFRLMPFLAERCPALTQEVIAADADRCWMLSRDAGTRLREATDRPAVDHWADLLPRYAELQMDMAAQRPALEAMSVPDRTLAVLARDLRATVEEPEMILQGDPRGLTEEQLGALRARLDAFDADCAALAALGIPETLQHDDLHDANAFVRDDRYVVFDWGDACISHPFHTLAVTLRAVANRYELDPGGPEVRRLVDAYLEPWQRVAPAEDLRRAAELARRTGTIGRAMAYRSWVNRMPSAIADEERESIPYGLRLFLADGPWGSWDDGSF